MAIVKLDDLMSGKLKAVRFGVGRNDATSLTFGVRKQNNEAYLYCREFNDFKLSLHSSGRHRIAEVSELPRAPIFQTKQLSLKKRRYSTFCRIIFTIEDEWPNVPKSLKVPKFLIPLFPSTSLGMINIGFLPHHPNRYFETSRAANCAVIKIASDKFIIFTRQVMSYLKFRQTSYLQAAINPYYDPQFVHQENAEGTFDHLAMLMTNLNTYILWAHHGTITSDQAWLANHPATKEMFQAREDQISGTFAGPSLEEEMDTHYPGWRDEYSAKFGVPPQKAISE